MDIREILLLILKRLMNMDFSSHTWFTPEQLAHYLGLSVHTIYQYVSDDKIPFHKIPGSSRLLFHRDEVDCWILGNRDKNDRKMIAELMVDDIWEKV